MITAKTIRAFFHVFPPFLGLILFLFFTGHLVLLSSQAESNILALENHWNSIILKTEQRYSFFGALPKHLPPDRELLHKSPLAFLKAQELSGWLINPRWKQHLESLSRDWQQLQVKLDLLKTHFAAFMKSPAGQRIRQITDGRGDHPAVIDHDTEITAAIDHLLVLRETMAELEGIKHQSVLRMEGFLTENRSRGKMIRSLMIVVVLITTVYLILYGVFYSETGLKKQQKLHDRLEAANRELMQKNADLQQEIEDRENIRFRLQEAEKQADLIIETTPNGFGMVDAERRVLFINPGLQNMSGYSSDELEGLYFESLVPERLLPALRQKINEVYKGQIDHFEFALPDKNGEIRDFLISPRSIYDDNGLETGAFAIFTDISRIKQTEKQLQESKQMLERVINTIPQFIFWKNRQLQFEGCSRDFARAAGFREPEDVVGKTSRDMCWKQDEIDQYIAEDRQVLSSGRAILHRIQKQTQADGKTVFIDINRIPLFDEENNVVGILGAYEDITERLKAEKLEQERERQLIQADKMISLGILVAGVAHEMNNPNQFIISHIEPLKRAWEGAMPILEKYYSEHGDFRMGGVNYSKLKDRLPSIFQNILEGTRRINVIVKELKEFSQEKPAEHLESIQINSVVQSALTLISNLINRSTNHFNTDYGQDLPQITGHYQHLEQVVINLVQNACQALTSKEDHISISTRFDDKNARIVVEIADEGRGVDADQISHMADPFFTTKRDSGGIGLGLSISSTIVMNHGGKLEFQPGKKRGMTASVLLPVVKGNKNRV